MLNYSRWYASMRVMFALMIICVLTGCLESREKLFEEEKKSFFSSSGTPDINGVFVNESGNSKVSVEKVDGYKNSYRVSIINNKKGDPMPSVMVPLKKENHFLVQMEMAVQRNNKTDMYYQYMPVAIEKNKIIAYSQKDIWSGRLWKTIAAKHGITVNDSGRRLEKVTAKALIDAVNEYIASGTMINGEVYTPGK